MGDMEKEFAALIGAARSGDLEAALSKSVLREAKVRRHPLNFLAARVEDDAGQALRLHLFDERFRFKQTGLEVHDHTFDYESFVVDGAVEQTIYEAIPDAGGAYEVLEVSYSHGGSALQRSGRYLQLVEQRRETFTAGETYRLPHGVLHRLDLVGPSATTLVLTRHVGGRPLTIGRSSGDNPPSTARTPVCDTGGNPMTLSTHSISRIVEAALSADQI
ncbi:hypothetical protein [Stakelama saccharophila]|uniref:Uncharacterized protein n=1 Tax=Stakelama saccharophila TaxID=3075605 RepID=A0ABZ0B6Y3_9SPHN|nr:hypothetical protein [Stakelama sp. W311]WNO53180.1 hypothetical protein RPR59_12095 [Stakelama sp. W311]